MWESGEILGGFWGWSLFRGVDGGGAWGECDGLPAFLDLSLPIYAVGVMASGLPHGRDGPDLDSTSSISFSTGPMWPLNSLEAHRNQAKRSQASQDGGGSEI